MINYLFIYLLFSPGQAVGLSKQIRKWQRQVAAVVLKRLTKGRRDARAA